MSIRGPSKCVSLAKTNRGYKSRYTVPLRKKKILNFRCGGGAGRGGMERNEAMSLYRRNILVLHPPTKSFCPLLKV